MGEARDKNSLNNAGNNRNGGKTLAEDIVK